MSKMSVVNEIEEVHNDLLKDEVFEDVLDDLADRWLFLNYEIIARKDYLKAFRDLHSKLIGIMHTGSQWMPLYERSRKTIGDLEDRIRDLEDRCNKLNDVMWNLENESDDDSDD